MKYELINKGDLYRIKALKNIPRYKVKKGDLGGRVSSKYTLSQEGDCWIDYSSKALDQSKVWGDAYVSCFSTVKGYGSAFGSARLQNATIRDRAQVHGNAVIQGTMLDQATAFGNAKVMSNGWLSGYAVVAQNAEISDRKDAVTFSNVGSCAGTLTIYRTAKEPWVNRGCFTGSIDDFLAKSQKEHDDTIHLEYVMLVEVALSVLKRGKNERHY